MSAVGSEYDNPFKVEANVTFNEICMNAQNNGMNRFYVLYNNHTYDVSLPQNGINSDTSFVVLSGGHASYLTNTQVFFDKTSMPESNTIVVGVCKNDNIYDVSSFTGAYDLCDNLKNLSCIDNQINMCGFSDSGYRTLIAGANKAKEGYDVNVFVGDPAAYSEYLANDIPSNGLEHLNIISFETVSANGGIDAQVNYLSDAGANIYRINLRNLKKNDLYKYSHDDVSSQILSKINVNNISSDGINFDMLIAELLGNGNDIADVVQKFENGEWVSVTDYNEIYETFNPDIHELDIPNEYYNSSFKSLIEGNQIDIEGINAIDYNILQRYMSSISGPLNLVASDEYNSKSILPIGEISEYFLSIGISSSLDTIKSINDGLYQKIRYELIYLMSNVCEVEENMDSTLASLIGGNSVNTNEYLVNLSTGIKDIFSDLSNKGLIQFDSLDKNFGVVSIGDLDNLQSGFNNEIYNLLTDISHIQECIYNPPFTNDMKSCAIWNIFEKKVEDYMSLLDNGHKVLNQYRNAVNDAIKYINNYIESTGFDPLDSSKKPKLEEKINTLNAENESLQTKMEMTKTEYYTDEYGNTQSRVVPYYSDAEIQRFEQRIEANLVKIEECQKEIAAIEKLPNIINKANKMVNDVLNEIYNSYGNRVNDFAVGVDTNYIAPTNINFHNMSATGKFDSSQYNGSDGVVVSSNDSSKDLNSGISSEMNERFSNIH